jgi:membrane peptidoglycan carboxypeptidase
VVKQRLFRVDEGWEVIGGTAQRLRRVALLGVVIIVCAAMVAALCLPLVLAGGGVAAAGVERIDEIPELVEPELPQRSVLYAADGTLLGVVYSQNRVEVPISAVPQVLVDAIIAIEDSRFYEHRGVDVRGTARALRSTATGGGVQGGSTITQQYVKNVLALGADDPEEAASATERTPRRKLIEAHHALELERRLSKDEILERYLNVAYLGGGAWGVQAAAQTFFAVDVGQLTLPQAALIAGQLQSPSRTDPFDDPDAALARRNVVLSRMAATGVVDGAEAAAAAQSDLGVVGRPAPNGCTYSAYPFFCDMVVAELGDHPALGDTSAERAAALRAGGLVVRTTLERREADAAQAAVDGALGRRDRVAATMAVVEPGTGAIRATAVNRDYGTGEGQSVLPFASTASHPGGSTFKIFTLTAALESGVRIDDTLPGGAQHASTVFDNPERGYFTNADSGGRTDISVRDATISSQNTGFVQLTEQTGVAAAADAAVRLGVTSFPATGDGAPRADEGSFPLGARSASPVEMANVAATLAAGGVRCIPTTIAAIERDGVVVEGAGPRCERTVDASVAATVSSVLGEVTVDGTGRAANLGRPTAGKTGTSQNFGSAWFVGFTPQRAAAVMLGDPRGVTYTLEGVGGQPRVFGGGLPAEVFAAAMTPIHDGWPVLELPRPDPAHLVASVPASLPDVIGLSERRARAVLAAAGVDADVVEVPANALLGDGIVSGVRGTGGRVTLEVTSTR